MFSDDNLQLFSKWYSIMPNKISGKFKNIYISNLNNLHEFQEISKIFVNAELILNNLLGVQLVFSATIIEIPSGKNSSSSSLLILTQPSVGDAKVSSV